MERGRCNRKTSPPHRCTSYPPCKSLWGDYNIHHRHHHQSSGSSLITTSLSTPSSSTLPTTTSPLLLPPCLASRISTVLPLGRTGCARMTVSIPAGLRFSGPIGKASTSISIFKRLFRMTSLPALLITSLACLHSSLVTHS